MFEKIEKIPYKKVRFYSVEEEKEHIEILQKLLFRLLKDRLYTRFIPFADFAEWLGTTEGSLRVVFSYHFGMDFRDFIFLLRTIDALSFSRRYECRNMGLQELCKFSGASPTKVNKLSLAIKNESLKAILAGRLDLSMNHPQKRDKEYKDFRNEQQKRNSLFLESIKSREYSSNDRYDKTYIDKEQPPMNS